MMGFVQPENDLFINVIDATGMIKLGSGGGIDTDTILPVINVTGSFIDIDAINDIGSVNNPIEVKATVVDISSLNGSEHYHQN